MTPFDVVIWSGAVIFVLTAALTLLHISGIRPMPDPSHGKILFRALILEIVVIGVAAFGIAVNPDQKYLKSDVEDHIELSASRKADNPPGMLGHVISEAKDDTSEEAIKSVQDALLNKSADTNNADKGESGKDCEEITVMELSIPISGTGKSKIQKNCPEDQRE